MKRIVVTTLVFMASVAQALSLGDQAPALNIADWVKGTPVDLSKNDGNRVYVVEFWATWCEPCRVSIPHLSELQEKYHDQGVTIIGITDEEHSDVDPFMKGLGAQMEYTVALDRDGITSKAYAEPFGVSGIPYAYIVDQSGALVWHGHPMENMDAVLDKVLAGTYDVADAVRENQQAELIKLWLEEYLVLTKYGLDTDRADEVGDRLVATANDDAPLLNSIAWTILVREDMAYRNTELALRAVERANELTGGNIPDVLDTYAKALAMNGRMAEAVAAQEKAIELCTDDALMADLRTRLSEYQNSRN